MPHNIYCIIANAASSSNGTTIMTDVTNNDNVAAVATGGHHCCEDYNFANGSTGDRESSVGDVRRSSVSLRRFFARTPNPRMRGERGRREFVCSR